MIGAPVALNTATSVATVSGTIIGASTGTTISARIPGRSAFRRAASNDDNCPPASASGFSIHRARGASDSTASLKAPSSDRPTTNGASTPPQLRVSTRRPRNVRPQGACSNAFGRPIRVDRPAARITPVIIGAILIPVLNSGGCGPADTRPKGIRPNPCRCLDFQIGSPYTDPALKLSVRHVPPRGRIFGRSSAPPRAFAGRLRRPSFSQFELEQNPRDDLGG